MNLTEYIESALSVAIDQARAVNVRQQFLPPWSLEELLTAMVSAHGMVAQVRIHAAAARFSVRFVASASEGVAWRPFYVYHREVFHDEDRRIHGKTLHPDSVQILLHAAEKAIAACHGVVL